MSDIDKIQRYIKNTPMTHEKTSYQLDGWAIIALYQEANKSLFRCIGLAFEYGKAKGYRAGKKASRETGRMCQTPRRKTAKQG